jgi:hypothetical protein
MTRTVKCTVRGRRHRSREAERNPLRPARVRPERHRGQAGDRQGRPREGTHRGRRRPPRRLEPRNALPPPASPRCTREHHKVVPPERRVTEGLVSQPRPGSARVAFTDLAALGLYKHFSVFLLLSCGSYVPAPPTQPSCGRQRTGCLVSALRLFPPTIHPPLALRVAPAPSGTATRSFASSQKTTGGRGGAGRSP